MINLLATQLVLADTLGWHHDDIGFGWWLVMMIGMVVFWGLVIFGVVWLVRGGLGSTAGADRESAVEILDRRLAQGDISPEEYDRRRATLEGRGPETGNG